MTEIKFNLKFNNYVIYTNLMNIVTSPNIAMTIGCKSIFEEVWKMLH